MKDDLDMLKEIADIPGVEGIIDLHTTWTARQLNSLRLMPHLAWHDAPDARSLLEKWNKLFETFIAHKISNAPDYAEQSMNEID